MPGVLPVLNKKVVEYAIKACLATHCEVQTLSRFARKNYFYPDLPKGYQITQFELPIGLNGHINIQTNGTPKKIGLTRIHLEEDAGKSIHGEHLGSPGKSYVDYNRTGVPLIEIVSEPDLRSPAEAREYLVQLKAILDYAEVSDVNMEEGSLRCDANVSLRPVGQKEFGTRTELKNINSFKFVQKALEYEIERQAKVLDQATPSCRRPGYTIPTREPPFPCAPRKRPTTTGISRSLTWCPPYATRPGSTRFNKRCRKCQSRNGIGLSVNTKYPNTTRVC